MGLFSKKGQKSASDTATPTVVASVEVLVEDKKIERATDGYKKWESYRDTLDRPVRPHSPRGEDYEGYVITPRDNEDAVRIKDEINALLGMRAAAKLVAPYGREE